MPLTTSGKVNYASLPQPPATARQSVPTAPATVIEQQLFSIWKETLNLQYLGHDDGFFDIGGNSLLALRVVAKMQEAFGVRVELRDFFNAPRIRDIARLIAMSRSGHH
jgi:acyl carrier protein